MSAPRSDAVVLVLRDEDPQVALELLQRRWEHLRGRSGQVLFKPNLIHHRHAEGGDHATVVTQPPVLELGWRAADALQLSGARVVADAPQGDADFDQILERTQLDVWARNRGVTIVDLRRTRYEERKGVPTARVSLPGDPAGAVHVDLGRNSAFYGSRGLYGTETNTFYGADYDVRSGNWWGNDTTWRMVVDLNRILRYARPDGSTATLPQRQAVSLIDGRR